MNVFGYGLLLKESWDYWLRIQLIPQSGICFRNLFNIKFRRQIRFTIQESGSAVSPISMFIRLLIKYQL